MSTSAIEYLNSFAWLGSRPGLERVSELLSRLDKPQNKLKYVHLAGTNGKGSTACFTAEILQAAGYRTGLFTSPFIHKFNEQMQVNGKMISNEDLEKVVAKVKIHADAMEDHPTTFELVTAVAFCWFLDEACDIVVLETGMGGALDSTNVIKSPEASVITPIDMDHMEFLGKTIADIAKAKAGIIKQDRPVVTAKQHPKAAAVLAETAANFGTFILEADTVKPGKFSFKGQKFSCGNFSDLCIKLLGRYQMDNAALALKTIEILNQQGWNISGSAIRSGLQSANWPGRFELALENPPTIIDGGHNAQGAIVLADNLKRYFPNKPITFVMGVLADKDVQAILTPILPLAKQFYTVTPDSPRAMPAKDLTEIILKQGVAALPMDSIEEALTQAKEFAGDDGVVCYFGSLYSVGAARIACSDNRPNTA